MAEKKNGTGRTRNWATIVYPESAPNDWLVKLGEECIQTLISPLHDKDMNPTNEPKKEHYHVLIMFDSVKTSDQAKEVFELIGGVGCQKVASLRGYARYLCHLDNPEKHQYSVNDVMQFGGVDYQDVIGLVTDKYVAISEMMDFCKKYNITNFALLADYAREHNQGWFRTLADTSTVFMDKWLKSFEYGTKTGAHVPDKVYEDMCEKEVE